MPRSRIRGMAYLLPMELVEQIFSHLEDDRRSLCACALVHRAWVYSSQRCIFRTVAITSVYEWENLLRFLLAHPHIRPLICRLEWLLRGRHPGMGNSTILAVPKLFPRAQCLAFDAWITLCALSASFPALAVLEFHATSDRDDDLDGDLDRALTMHISKPFHSSPCCTWPLTMRSVFARDVIQVDSCPVEEWIRKNVRLDTLHSLSLSLPEIPDQPPFRHVLASLPALEDLTLCLEVPMKETDLALGTIRVSSLHLLVYPDVESVPFISRILRETSFPVLRHLHVTLEWRTMHTVEDRFPKMAFDPVLSASRDA